MLQIFLFFFSFSHARANALVEAVAKSAVSFASLVKKIRTLSYCFDFIIHCSGETV